VKFRSGADAKGQLRQVDEEKQHQFAPWIPTGAVQELRVLYRRDFAGFGYRCSSRSRMFGGARAEFEPSRVNPRRAFPRIARILQTLMDCACGSRQI